MRQRGTLTVEFALMVPALVLLFGIIIGGARVWLARGAVEQVAGAAARAASLERTAGSAQVAAKRLAGAQAAVGGLRCQTLSIQTNTSAFAAPVGSPGRVEVTARCEVPLADVLVPGWPGTVLVSATSSEVVDSYRGRK
ncbi:TadE/TadG family type IV pilus assembly protein [Propionicimonas sp.]|uniref:TadE/TadG family type IV pilus assembly protein n=1 Tax=Propionicimonas sp. TaxID=1955623 RepID=UPI00179857B3|nr:TadE family protein [Propionicimonas sp.]MBU3976290.1 pilus assembly protein [Actinomycetota bacterium]MBA3022117.1 pilus assembly protein [Propionicimonas sp.]MBU3987447.1 pilus assembly protein [Actinomycetota bacterium]MBU4006608.1 pilus assembly protein [Actinomycetota bacterium]MBU4065213.1 pilus assembly protein [Actinomycetota bacterium]